jgi:uncharacterized membrane protein (DUF485 family)
LTTSHDISEERAARYIDVQQSSEFGQLRTRFRKFVFPMTALFLAWYFFYVLLAAFAPEFMAISFWGRLNIGLVLGLLQFVSTFTITMIYVRWADKNFDPEAQKLAERMELGDLT